MDRPFQHCCLCSLALWHPAGTHVLLQVLHRILVLAPVLRDLHVLLVFTPAMPPGRPGRRPGQWLRGREVGNPLSTAVLLAALSIAVNCCSAEILGTPVRVADDQEADIAAALLRAYTAVSRSVLSGSDQGILTAAAAPSGISSASAVAVANAARAAFAAAVASWQLTAAAAPSNRGLQPQKLVINGRVHYYQARAMGSSMPMPHLMCGWLLQDRKQLHPRWHAAAAHQAPCSPQACMIPRLFCRFQPTRLAQ